MKMTHILSIATILTSTLLVGCGSDNSSGNTSVTGDSTFSVSGVDIRATSEATQSPTVVEVIDLEVATITVTGT